MNAKFVPIGDNPHVELTCGKHDKNGRFHPKNIKLTAIARLRWFVEYADGYRSEWRNPHMRMVGYPSTTELEIYNQMMKERGDDTGRVRKVVRHGRRS